MKAPDTFQQYETHYGTVESRHIITSNVAAKQETISKRSYTRLDRWGTQSPQRFKAFRANTEATTPYQVRGIKFEQFSPARAYVQWDNWAIPSHPLEWYDNVCNTHINSLVTPGTDYDATSDAIANNAALTSFTGKVAGRITSFQGGVVIGELRETLGLFKRPLAGIQDRLQSYVRNLQRIKRKHNRSRKGSTAKMLEDAASAYLECVFGWRPFFNDVSDALNTLARLNEKPPDREGVRGTGSSERNLAAVSTVAHGFAQGGNIIAERHRRIGCKYTYYGSVDCRPEGGFLGRPETIAGIGAENFIPTVWEVIPYSFLVDYFTNVGEIVRAWSLCKNRVKRIAYARRAWNVDELRGWRVVPPQADAFHRNLSYSWSPGAGCVRMDTYQRAVYTGSLVPDFRWKIPTHASQYLNIAALAILRKKVLPFMKTG
jgi:hypothetical protein